LEREEAENRAKAAKAKEELDELNRLRTFVEAEEKMQAAEARVRELEAARLAAQSDIFSATQDLDSLRSELYEMPGSPRGHGMQHTRGDGGNPKLNRLQAEAYIERHELDELMEDLLASLIEYMPTYPFPYLVKFLQQKAGISTNELELSRGKIAELAKALEKSQGEFATEVQEHAETKQAVKEAQAELAKTVRDVTANAKEERKMRDQLDRSKAELETSLRKERDQAAKMQMELGKAQNEAKMAQSQIGAAQKSATDAAAQSARLEASMQAKLEAAVADAAAAAQAKIEAAAVIAAATAAAAAAEAAAAKAASERALKEQLETQQAAAASAAAAHKQEIAAQAVEADKAAEEVKRGYAEEAGLSETFTSTPIVYTVRIKTGDKRGAGTDSNCYLHIMGEKGDSGRLKLDKSKGHGNKFERARTDEFELKSLDVGKLTKIKIGHDNKGLGAGWYLDSVAIDVPALGKRYTFDADRWLDKKEGDGKIEIVIPALEGALEQYIPKSDYTITTRTGSESGASLDNANVYVMIYGAEGKSEEQKLENGGTCFDKGGKADDFRFQLENLGEVTMIRVRHDGKGMFGASWYLGSVEVFDAKHNILYKCAADRWLRKKEGIEAELPVTSKVVDGEEIEIEGADVIQYEVHVLTGKTSGAGTDATVHVNIYGENSDTGDRQLRKSNHMNKFENGQTDKFMVGAADLGKLTRLKVWHDNNSMMGADWELDSITVVDPRDGTSTLFNCHAWLSKSKGLVKELKPDSGGPEEFQIEKAAGMDYNVTVYTSDIRNASTDANVHCILYGETNDTGKLKLAKSSTNKDKFQRGKFDKFVLNAIDVGEIKKIWIGHDNARTLDITVDPSWHLDKVEVEMPQLGKEVTFGAGRWLAKGKDDGELGLTLLPTGDAEEIVAKLPWEVVVYTGTVRGAGTDGNVTMQVFGKNEDGDNLDDHLDFKPKVTDDMFEKADVDRFGFELIEIGEPFKLIVEQDGAGFGADWFLDKVIFINPRTSSSYEFKHNDWVKSKKPVELVLGEKLGMTLDGKGAEAKEMTIELGFVTYTLNVTTSNDKNAGTDANVSAVITGENGSSKILKLEKSKTNMNKFEKGKTDVFEFAKIADLGKVTKLSLTSDGSRGTKLMHPEWKVEKVEVVSSEGTTVEFGCDQWFKKSDGLKHEFVVPGSEKPKAAKKSATAPRPASDEEVEAEEGAPAAAAPLAKTARKSVSTAVSAAEKPKAKGPPPPRTNKSYKISVVTGTEKKSGTDAGVSMWITGAKGKSAELKLDKSNNKDKFESGQTDNFTFDFLDLGELSKIKVKSDGGRGWSHKLDTQWYLDKVNISCPGSKGKWSFECGQWFDGKQGKEHSFTLEGGDSDDEMMNNLAGR
jgi:hypothetical protein